LFSKGKFCAHRIICETYGENVIAIRIDITLVNSDFDISDKKRFDRSPAVEEDELRKGGKQKILRFNLYCINFFYCNKKIAKNWQKLLHRFNSLIT